MPHGVSPVRRSQAQGEPGRAAVASRSLLRARNGSFLSQDDYLTRMDSANAGSLRELLSQVWSDLDRETMDDADLDAAIAASMSLIPAEDAPGRGITSDAAEDAAATTAYALRCRRTGSSQEAAGAARRVYETLDHFVVDRDDVPLGTPEGEAHALEHPLLQAELRRQLLDLDELVHADNDGQVASRLRRRAEPDGARILADLG